ncbi:MAG: hypothetical protein ACE5IK_01955 [Acidobacteriota bacterium]
MRAICATALIAVLSVGSLTAGESDTRSSSSPPQPAGDQTGTEESAPADTTDPPVSGDTDPAAATGPRPEKHPDPDLEALRAQVQSLIEQQKAITDQLQTLQAKLEASEQTRRKEALREAARAAASAAGTPESKGIDATTEYRSGTRMQPQLNPEISVTGDLLAIADERDTDRFSNREWEINIRSDLDPFSQLNFTVSFPEDEGAEIEEGYITWSNLPGRLGLSLGKRRQQFGVLNRFHQHALPQVDAPLVIQASFGEEGLDSTGLFLDWSLPSLWADSTEFSLEITNGDNEVAFGGPSFDRLAYLGRFKSFWDVGTSSYFEFALDGVFGPADPMGDQDHDIYGVDSTYFWAPQGRTADRSLTVRGLLVRSSRQFDTGPNLRVWGGYLYGEFRINRRFIAGLRFDRADDQLIFGKHEWGYSPYLTIWESEFVRLRSQFNYRRDSVLGLDRSLLLQVTLAAGPHKHAEY